MTSPLEVLANLKQGWDGYDGRPITEQAMNAARHLAFVPMNNGGVQIEFHAGGIDFEIEIQPDGKVGGMFYDSSGDA